MFCLPTKNWYWKHKSECKWLILTRKPAYYMQDTKKKTWDNISRHSDHPYWHFSLLRHNISTSPWLTHRTASRQSYHFPTMLWTLGHAGLWLEIQLIGIVALQDWGMCYSRQTHRKVWKSVMVHKGEDAFMNTVMNLIELTHSTKMCWCYKICFEFGNVTNQNRCKSFEFFWHINMLGFSSAFRNQRQY